MADSGLPSLNLPCLFGDCDHFTPPPPPGSPKPPPPPPSPFDPTLTESFFPPPPPPPSPFLTDSSVYPSMHPSTSSTSTESTGPTQTPVEHQNPGESYTTTIVISSGDELFTITSLVEHPTTRLNQAGDDSPPKTFWNNRPAVIGVFVALAVVILIFILAIVLWIFRSRRKAKRWEQDNALTSGTRVSLDENEFNNEKSWYGTASVTNPTNSTEHMAYLTAVEHAPAPFEPYLRLSPHPYANANNYPRQAPTVDPHSPYSASLSPSTSSLPTEYATALSASPSRDGHLESPKVQSPLSAGTTSHPYASSRRYTMQNITAEEALVQTNLGGESANDMSPLAAALASEWTGSGSHTAHDATNHLTINQIPSRRPSLPGKWRDGSSNLLGTSSTSDVALSNLAEGGSFYEQQDRHSNDAGSEYSSNDHPQPTVVRQDPRFSGAFGPSAWKFKRRPSADAGTLREEDEERFRQSGAFGGMNYSYSSDDHSLSNGRVLRVTNE